MQRLFRHDYYGIMLSLASWDVSQYSFGSLLGQYLLSQLPSSLETYAQPVYEVHVSELNTAVAELIGLDRPFLLKGAIKQPNVTHVQTSFLGNSTQNIFPPCDVLPPPFMGETMMCDMMTLNE